MLVRDRHLRFNSLQLKEKINSFENGLLLDNTILRVSLCEEISVVLFTL